MGFRIRAHVLQRESILRVRSRNSTGTESRSSIRIAACRVPPAVLAPS